MQQHDDSDIRLEDGTAPERGAVTPRSWRWASYGIALLAALGLGYLVMGIPLQLADGAHNIFQMQAETSGYIESFRRNLDQQAYTRPMMWLQYQLLYDLADGNYYLTYKLFQAMTIVAVMLLFTRLLRVRSASDLALSIFAMSVLLGSHTFEGTVREAFPINHFLSAIMYALIVLNLADSRHRWWKDAAAVVVFFVAVYHIESGLLVWVAMVAAYMFGLRGLSRVGLAGSTLVLMLYVYLRFIYFNVGAPQLIERSSGFGFRTLEAVELQARFGEGPLPFYLYNVATSFSSVLLSEPRAGVWTLLGSYTTGEVEPWMVINVLASVMALALLVGFTVDRAPHWVRWRFDRSDALFLVAVGVLGANACLSFAYTKDVIMSVAGALYAVAVYVAAAHYLDRLSGSRPTGRRIALSAVFFLVLGGAWATRSLALQKVLMRQTLDVQNDWAFSPDYFEEIRAEYPTPEMAALIDRLQREAMHKEAIHGLPRHRLLGPFLDPY